MAREIQALQSLWNGELTGEREQRVLTPLPVLEAVYRLWPEGIALDAAGAPGSLVAADKWACPDTPEADYRDGLAIDWPERTYCNPPYDNLRAWVDHASKHNEVLLLGPVRSHRPWWRDAVFGYASAVCWCGSLTFVGFDQPFPAPLCVAYYGSRHKAFGRAFSELGESSTLSWRRPKPPRQVTLRFG